MPTPQRRFEPGVIARLFAQPYRFQYFQAVRLLELWLKRNGVPHEGALANFLRFQNSLSQNFPPSQIEALRAEPADADPGAAPLPGRLKYIRMTPAFMGFLGPAGSLPAHYTERIAAHQSGQKDEAPRAFLDAFSSRSLALFYEAWRKYRLALKYELGEGDRFLPLLLALGGLGYGALRRRLCQDGGVLDESMGYFAAALRQRPASASVIARVLSDYFGQPIGLTQFVGRWYAVPAAQQSVLGGANASLGAGALAGARVWQRDLCLRLRVGPLGREAFEAFLPGGPAALALAKLLSMFTGPCLEYEVQLVLRAADVDGASLAPLRRGGRLGWDSFLVSAAQEQDRADVRYEIHTIGALQS